jgi:hypothetical protein
MNIFISFQEILLSHFEGKCVSCPQVLRKQRDQVGGQARTLQGCGKEEYLTDLEKAELGSFRFPHGGEVRLYRMRSEACRSSASSQYRVTWAASNCPLPE